MRICVNVGESMRSEVSSRRQRRGAGVEVTGGEGGVASEIGEGELEVEGGVADMPDSWRTSSS